MPARQTPSAEATARAQCAFPTDLRGDITATVFYRRSQQCQKVGWLVFNGTYKVVSPCLQNADDDRLATNKQYNVCTHIDLLGQLSGYAIDK